MCYRVYKVISHNCTESPNSEYLVMYRSGAIKTAVESDITRSHLFPDITELLLADDVYFGMLKFWNVSK